MSALAGKRVLIARAEGQGDGAARLLTERGAVPVVIPSIEIGPPDDPEPLRAALAAIDTFDWVVLTSSNGVAALLGQTPPPASQARRGGRELSQQPKFAVVGSATAEALAAGGRSASLVAKESRGEGLARELVRVFPRGSSPRVLWVRAQAAPDALPHVLIEAGAQLTEVAAYRTRACIAGAAEIARRLRERSLDVVVFSSGSTVDSICDALAEDAVTLLSTVIVACIGPVTLTAAQGRGLRVDVTPAVATFLGVIEAVERHLLGI